MTITIAWTSRVINVPKADTTLLQSSPTEIRELDLNTLRLVLKDIEDGEEGMSFQPAHNHTPPVTVGGVTLARVVEIINGYTVTFEDGQYAVNLVGANSNVADNVNVNQVSVRSANSAGLVQTREIEYASFDGVVSIDTASAYSGTTYPIGTPQQPVNNLAAALLIAQTRGLSELWLLSDLTISTGEDISNLTISSDDWLSVTVASGAVLSSTVFSKVSLYGVMDGAWNVVVDCWVYDITNFSGWVRGGSIGSVALAVGLGEEFGGQSFFDDLVPLYPGVTSTIVMNTNTQVSFTNNSDITTIESMTTGSIIECGLLEGTLIIDATCTGGSVGVNGVGEVQNSGSVTLNTDGLTNPAAVWTTTTGDATATLVTLIGRILQNKQITDPVSGTITVYADNGTTPLLTANLFEDAAGVQAYRGLGAERRERLA